MQWAFFLLFLFSIGYKTGPQFFRGLGRGALPQVGLALLFCGTGLATTYAISRVIGFDAGMAAGLLAGGLNASAAIGTAADALARLPLDDSARNALATGVTVAFAVTYLVGLVTSIDRNAREVAKYIIATPDTVKHMAGLIDRHPDRFLFGTDEVAPANQAAYLKVFYQYDPLWKALTPDASRKVRKENYERLFDAARIKVRAWEREHSGAAGGATPAPNG